MSNTTGTRALLRTVTHLLRLDKDMTLTKLQVFLLVAQPEDGALVSDITQRTGLNQSTVARSLSALGPKPYRGKGTGLGWVNMHPDSQDPRRVRCTVSQQGLKALADIETILG